MKHRTEWRDCQAWCDENLSMNTCSNEASKYFDISLSQFVTSNEHPQYGGLIGCLDKMMQSDPDFVLGHCLRQGLHLDNLNCAEFRQSVHEMRKLSERVESELSEREKMHVKAMMSFCSGDLSSAGDYWQSIVKEYPNDMMAIAFGYHSAFLSGNSEGMR